MPVVLARIDDRLIHGQITCSWVNKFKANRIIVVSDKVASNPFMVKALPLAAPLSPDIKIGALHLNEAIEDLKSGKYEPDNIFLMTENPQDMLALVKNGVKFDWINVGQQGQMSGMKDQKRVTKTVAVGPEQAKIYREMAKYVNNKLIYQQVPEEGAYDFLPILDKNFPE